ncbi:MAG: hypothetical protein ACJASQ_001161 [Crocinitomicaceae bacterium]
MKHCQLIVGLDELGLEASNKHCLEIVADLMRVPEGNVEFDWGRGYVTSMAECSGLDVEQTSGSMRPYTETCYADLVEVLSSGNTV